MTPGRHEHVLRFQVPMDNVLGVGSGLGASATCTEWSLDSADIIVSEKGYFLSNEGSLIRPKIKP